VQPAHIPEQKVFNCVDFPLVLEPNPHPVEGVSCRPDGRCQIDALDEALDEWVEFNHDMIDQLLLKVRWEGVVWAGGRLMVGCPFSVLWCRLQGTSFGFMVG
jgi:hypothetical protein